MKTADYVDIDQFMGAWFVIGYTPLIVDKNAHNGVEHYYKDESGKILTTYEFRKDRLDGELKIYQPTGFVYTEDNVEWRMQFLWPFKSKYVVAYLSEDLQQTIVAHPNRKYAWIMSRSPSMEENQYTFLLDKLSKDGFQIEKIIKMPQDWDKDQERLQYIKAVGSSKPLRER